MELNKLNELETMRKANRCATLFELLCEALGHEPMSPTTNWREIAKSYSILMEDGFKLLNPNDNETAKD